jgi:hypothetical protein
MHGAPALAWNAALAAGAYKYAKSATSLGSPVPSSYDIPDADGGPAGENMAQAWPSISSMQQVVTMWYDQVENCNSDFPGCKNGTVNSASRFTTLIWKGTKVLGCAMSDNKQILVCRYGSGPGTKITYDTPNVLGGYIANVLKPTKSAQQCGAANTPAPVSLLTALPSTSKPSTSKPSACGDTGIGGGWKITLGDTEVKSCKDLKAAGGCDVAEWKTDILPKTCAMTCGLC